MLTLTPFKPQMAEQWDALVKASCNGTFLLQRRFMDYHAQRFTDCSLLFMDGQQPVAALPANIADGTVQCHGGLTYGPLVLAPKADYATVRECFALATEHYRTLGAMRLLYKPIPYIYNDGTRDDDLYELFRRDATLCSRALSTAIHLPAPLPMRTLRRRGVAKAQRVGLTIRRDGNLDEFWNILNHVLTTRHNVKPVHSPQEMKLLSERFPSEIRLYTVHTPEGETVAGAWVFVTRRVAHVQYIAANEAGRQTGALDLLFHHFVHGEFAGQEWLDFGVSTEDGGRVLNQGLLWQKEGFGGRGVCYDQYEYDLTN